MKFNTAAIFSLLAAFAVAKPSSHGLDFPPNENYLEYSGKNGLYIIHWDSGFRFPYLYLAEKCRLHLDTSSVTCRVKDTEGSRFIKDKFGGSAKLDIPMTINNDNNCNLEKKLVEVVVYNKDGSVDQTLGSLDGEVRANRIDFKNTDDCIYSGMFDNFTMEKY